MSLDVGVAHKYLNSDYFGSDSPSGCNLPNSILGWAKRMRELKDEIDEIRDTTDKNQVQRCW